MRQIYSLYKAAGTVLTEMKMSDIKPVDVFTTSSSACRDLSVRYFVVVDSPADTATKQSFTDLTALLTMTSLLDGKDITTLTWEDLGSAITDHMVMGYSTKVPDFMDASRSLCFAEPLQVPELFELFYTRVNVPKDRNVAFRRWQLLDLGVKKIDPDCKLDLSQCVLSVNGLLSIPTFFDDELLMPRGAEFMHSSTTTKRPSVSLLDFSSLGGIKCVPFSACTSKTKAGQKADVNFAMGLDVEIFLPSAYSLKDKSVFMVVGHTLFFPDSCKVVSDTSVLISPHHLPIGTCLLKQQLAANKFNESTDSISTETSIQEYIANGMYATEHKGAFFIIVDTPKLYIKKVHTHHYAQSALHVATGGVAGFLWDQSSMSIVDQTRLDYQSYTDFYAYNSPRMSVLTTHDYYNRNHAIEALHPFYEGFLPQVDASCMYAIQITRP